MSNERDDAVDDQAIAWCLRLNEAALDTTEQDELAAWLAQAPAHRERLRRMQHLWDGIGIVADAPELRALQQQALAAVQQTGARRAGGARYRLTACLGIAAALLLAVALVAFLRNPGELYVTRVGEQRTVILADGSTMVLDGDTAVRARFSGERRDLTLERGRASFKVAKNPLRPFAVTSGDNVVVAVGTAFSVERLAREFRVALYEGRVAVLRDTAAGFGAQLARTGDTRAAAEQALKPGSELIVRDDAREAILRPSAMGDRLGGGQLSFVDEPLTIAVQRVNRYNVGTPIVVAPAAADVRISGVFNTGDTDAFVQGVVAAFPVRAVSSGAEILLTAQPSGDVSRFHDARSPERPKKSSEPR